MQHRDLSFGNGEILRQAFGFPFHGGAGQFERQSHAHDLMGRHGARPQGLLLPTAELQRTQMHCCAPSAGAVAARYQQRATPFGP